MSFKVYKLARDDTALMDDVLTLFGEVFGEPDTYGAARPGKPYMESLLGSDHFIALAAKRDGAVVGALAAYEFRKFERARSEVYIYDLAVAQDHRRQGIATAMIEALKEIAAARGAYLIFVQADRGDEPAIALYTSLGTREDIHHFDIKIG